MNPVVTRGEDLQSDLDTVAGALENLAEAAKTARGKLNILRIQAQGFWNRHHDKKVWWLDKDEETDDWALEENIRLKDAVNAAWATFNEAENDCACRISAVFGGPAYASPDQAGGTDLAYGLPTDAGERQMPGFDETFMDPANDFTAWLGSEFHPSLARFDNSTGQAVWDVVVTDALWGSAVGLVAMSGMWHPEGGWQLTPQGRWDNLKRSGNDALLDTAAFVGVYDDHGWLWESGEGGQNGGGSTWDRWTTNLWNSAGELWESHTAWSKREEDPEYSNATIGTNVVMMTGGLPLKLAKTLLGLGPGGSSTTPSPSDGSFSDSHSSTSGRGPGTGEWPSSPLPRDGKGGDTSTSGRFADQLAVLRESLLDPDQHHAAPSPQPDRPAPTPDRPDQHSDTPTPTTRTDTGSQRGDSDAPPADRSPEQHPQGRRDDDLGDQGDGRPPRSEDGPQDRSGPREEAKNPEPATGGGEGGGEQPPKDRTGTGGDDGEHNNDFPEDLTSGNSNSTPTGYQSPEPGTELYNSRIAELMEDPAKKNDNLTQHQLDKARREAEVGLAAERQGLVPGPIQRAEIDNSDPAFQRDQGDIIDASGQPWDIKGFRDTFPSGPRAGQPMPPGMRGGFDINRIKNEIQGELDNGENVLLDTSGISDPDNLKSLQDLVKNNLKWKGKVIFVE